MSNPGKEQISPHLVAVVRALRQKRDRWSTVDTIAVAAGVKSRTARAHLKRLGERGVVDWVEPFGGHRYRMPQELSNEAAAYVLEVGVIGETLES